MTNQHDARETRNGSVLEIRDRCLPVVARLLLRERDFFGMGDAQTVHVPIKHIGLLLDPLLPNHFLHRVAIVPVHHHHSDLLLEQHRILIFLLRGDLVAISVSPVIARFQIVPHPKKEPFAHSRNKSGFFHSP